MFNLKDSKRPEMYLLIVTLGWAFSFPLMKNASDFIDVNFFLALRLLIASILLIPVFIVKRNKFTKERIGKAIILGVFLFLIITLTFIGVSLTKAANIAFLTSLNVVFVPLILFLFKKANINIFNIISAVLVIIGVFLLSGGVSIGFDLGNIVGLLIGIIVAFQLIANKVLTADEEETFLIGSLQVFVAFILSSLFVIVRDVDISETIFNKYVIIGIVGTAILSTIMAFTLQTVLQKYTDPIKTSIYFSTEPIFALILSFIILKPDGTKDFYNINELFGLILIFAAVLLSDEFIRGKIIKKKK